jgi:hypothetical protein
MGAQVIGPVMRKEEPLPAGSLYIADLGYLDWGSIAARRAAGSYTLTRAQARTLYWTVEGKPLKLDPLLPPQVGQTNELWVRVADEYRYLMRLLIIRVPEEVAKRRRADLEAEALRRNRPLRQRAWELADWTILLTDAPAHLLRLQEALVLLRERWQMEMLYKLWKQYGRIDEWRTGNPWRILCELYAKLIGLLLQHWLVILFAQAGMNSAVWSSWRRSFATLPVLSSKLWQGAARFALSFKVSNGGCVQVAK